MLNIKLFGLNLLYIVLILLIFKIFNRNKNYGIVEILKSVCIGFTCMVFFEIIHFLFSFIDNLNLVYSEPYLKVALVEELSKFSAIVLLLSTIKKKSSMDILFYSVCVGASFSIIENIYYIKNIIDSEAYKLLFLRFITANILHLTCGFIVGYFMACARKFGRSIVKYSIFGLILAVLLHGTYNFSILMSTMNILTYTNFIILFCSILVFCVSTCIFLYKKVKRFETV